MKIDCEGGEFSFVTKGYLMKKEIRNRHFCTRTWKYNIYRDGMNEINSILLGPFTSLIILFFSIFIVFQHFKDTNNLFLLVAIEPTLSLCHFRKWINLDVFGGGGNKEIYRTFDGNQNTRAPQERLRQLAFHDVATLKWQTTNTNVFNSVSRVHGKNYVLIRSFIGELCLVL